METNEPRRERSRRTNLLAVLTAVAVVGVVSTWIVRSGGDDAPVRVVPADDATDTSSPGPVWAPDGTLATTDRVTPAGLHVQALLRTAAVPVDSRGPVECYEPTLADVVFDADGVTVARSFPLAEPPDGGVVVALALATEDEAVRRRSIADAQGPPDPRLSGVGPSTGDVNSSAFAFVASGPDLRRVTVRDAAGAVDEVDAVDGFAASGLAGPPADGSAFSFGSDVTATIELASGKHIVLESTDPATATPIVFAADGTKVASRAEELWRSGSHCATVTPVTLPPASDDQPDPSARPAVIDVIETVADGSGASGHRASLTDDPARMTEMLGQMPASMVEAQGPTLSAAVTDVVFVAPDTAIALVDVSLAGQVEAPQRFVKVVSEDGHWRVTWQSVCAVAASWFQLPACVGVTADYPPEARRHP